MYSNRLKRKWDNKNVLDYAVSVAEAKGIEKGIKQCIEEGIEKGIEKGEHKKAVAIAVEMKKDGLPFIQISKFTRRYLSKK